jgi:phospholipid/cholesterol/gamma-HCH transport system permease protein
MSTRSTSNEGTRASLPPESERPAPASLPPIPVGEPPPPGAGERLKQEVYGFFWHFGEVSRLFSGALRAAFRRPFEFREILRQIEALGVASMGIVVVTSLFIGMVMAVQFADGLRKFGGMEYTGPVVALTFVRELAPTLTAVIVGGRIGAGMTAELGAMAVTEQLDAFRALGADPVKKLVWPRLAASVLVMPLLASFALVVGFTGATWIVDWQFSVPAPFFLNSALRFVAMREYVAGLLKTPFFGAIVALIGCHYGLITEGGTAGVGRSTTRTVVAISITILIADLFLTKVAILLRPIF